jgi:hypothetical protein
MTYTVTDIYTTFFESELTRYVSQIAADFYTVDPEDMATMFFENIDKESYTYEEFKHVKSLAPAFEKLVHENFKFLTYTEEATGDLIVEAYR